MAEHRELSFDTLQQAIAEVERLAGENVRTTGSYSFAQIVNHLATTLDVATGRKELKGIPLPMRIIATLFRPLILSRPIKPGFKLPKDAQSFFWSTEDLAVDEQVAYFREAAEHFLSLESYPKHPLFGNMKPAESLKLQCGHCAMHLGFVHLSPES